MEGTEFFEGVRCLLVDRKDKPQWKYITASQASNEEIDAYFTPFEASSGNVELQI
jgi:Enoyl-CoA hydratase/isomerase